MIARALSASFVLAFVLHPASALACACCGGASGARLLGWSESGSSVLVERQGMLLCLTSSALEVWDRWHDAPTGCFDRLGDPDRRIDCGAVRRLDAPAIRTSRRGALYPREPRALPRRLLRVRLRPVSGRAAARFVHLDVRAGRSWQEVWSGWVHFRAPYAGMDGESAVIVDVWPSPTSNAALLRIQQEIDPAMHGHSSPYSRTRLVWIVLPSGVGAHARRVPAPDPRRSLASEDLRADPIVVRLED